MTNSITLSRSLLLVCLLGLLSACGGSEPETQAEVESHGHSHD
ncbi:hypothetical protein ABMZ67_13775 [Pseudomonas aeruginosa]|jgi:hypothetical protein|uniref:Efflux transporter periplasmic adaptor subunit n=2 Tax=Stutzerimonas stutzeri group TaxID=136846 RepID=A0AA47E4G2_9GAMM|nr:MULTISPECIES: hypothetical protein [Pseudomonadaceae]MCV6103185.1 hypothetical protein [Pseudomonas aeruginosa]MDE5050190.1 hypothetical protein [Pseudomonas aeruginosa]MDG9829637.1 hypothetical protein [Pseudomonas aeruginosa]MDH0410752.1 hypothetical protein [Pseudomonas aeruginosa]MDH1017192.1 hypothetical protein [Pseudomonas aeruginosa]|tara:strand:- start:1670 stop:1798 length:129 start_codon:yes stop_codon:yes gene_type:complete